MRYAKSRNVFGHPIGENQHIAFTIARMEARVHSARLAWLDAAHRLVAGQPFKLEASLAKLIGSEAAMDNARDATQIFGGYGVMNENPVARHYRDSKILEIGEGTTQVQLMVIARELGFAGVAMTDDRDVEQRGLYYEELERGRPLPAPARAHDDRGGQRPVLDADHEPAGAAPGRRVVGRAAVRAAAGELDDDAVRAGGELGRAADAGHDRREPRVHRRPVPAPAVPRGHAVLVDGRARSGSRRRGPARGS